jgi:hypothetical protein
LLEKIKVLFLAGIILSMHQLSAYAFEIARIHNIYFTGTDSFLMETSASPEIETIANQIIIKNARLSKQVPRQIFHSKHPLMISSSVSDIRSLFKAKDEIVIKAFAKQNEKFKLVVREVLLGQAYEIVFEPMPIEQTVVDEPKISKDLLADERIISDDVLPQLSSDVNLPHQAQVQAFDRTMYQVQSNPSSLENFMNTLDPGLKNSLKNDSVFHEDVYSKADAASMQALADKLESLGYTNQAYQAYKNSLAIDPSSTKAKLGLARTTEDKNESLKNFLESIDNQALIAVANSWHAEGLSQSNPKVIAQAMVPYQFAILKNPTEAKYRFDYAQILESSGLEFLGQASQRYLEAAVLAKKQYQEGNKSLEFLMRDSTEALIRVLTQSGRQEEALKYCNSYIAMGYRSFSDGRAIAAIIREIRYNKNPFIRS